MNIPAFLFIVCKNDAKVLLFFEICKFMPIFYHFSFSLTSAQRQRKVC